MTEGIRKEKNLPERIARSIILNEQLFIQDLKIFANTSIVGAQGAQAGSSSGGPSGVGNYLRKDGDIMDGPIAFQPSIASIVADQIDIRKSQATNYGSRVFLIAESGTEDELNFILGGTSGNFLTGAEFPGQILIISPIETHTITINNDPSGVGDATAVPPFNIRTPDGNPVVLQSEQSVALIYDSTSSQWSFLNAVGGSGGVAGNPLCFPEKDSGDQSGALTIVFDANRFCRMRVTGDLIIDFDTSSMVFGKIYFLTVEVLQDGIGQHTVTYSDAPFENNLTPKVFKAGNRYTSTRFYAYKLDAGSSVRIFAFDEFQDFSQEFFDGYIQARIITDQTGSLTANNHIEFEQAIATDSTIIVTTGAGQAAGQFSNFEVGHLYQCEVVLAIEAITETEPELSYQFYNVGKGQFFGSQARALAVSSTEHDSSMVIAKGFFVADSIGDIIEVRIKSMFGVDSIKAGDQSAEQMSYVVIKDCGVAGFENLPGNVIPAPEPTGPEFLIPNKGFIIGHMDLSGPTPGWFSLGGNPTSLVQNQNQVPAMGAGKFVKLRVHVISNNSGSSLSLFTVVNGSISALLGLAGTVGVHEIDLLGRTFVKDDIIGLRVSRGGGETGNILFNTWLELEHCSNDFWFWSDILRGNQGGFRYTSIIGNSLHTSSTGAASLSRDDWQRSVGRKGTIRDFVYYGNAPAGTGVTKVVIEVNDAIAFESDDIPPQGVANVRFDNVNIAVGADDLINVRIETRVGTTSDGLFGIRFQLD